MTTNIRHSIARSNEAPFDGHNEANASASFGDILAGLLHYPDAEGLVEQVAGIVRDDLAMIQCAAAHHDCLNEVIARIAQRAEWMLALAPELEHRMREAEERIKGGRSQADSGTHPIACAAPTSAEVAS